MKKAKRAQLEDLARITPALSEIAPGFRIPDFKSDEEEIAWLEANHERLGRLAEKHGIRVNLVLKEPTQQISIRLPVRDIEHAKKLAATLKTSWQTVLKRAVRSGLTVNLM